MKRSSETLRDLSDLTGSNGVIQELIKGTVERILKAEQEAHLGYEPYRKGELNTDNARNGFSKRTMKKSPGEVEIEIPRDRKGTFEPHFVQKHQSFDPDLEKRVISMYARGMITRDIGQQLAEFYGVEVSATPHVRRSVHLKLVATSGRAKNGQRPECSSK